MTSFEKTRIKGKGRIAPLAGIVSLIMLICLFLPWSSLYGAEKVVLYNIGTRDSAALDLFKRHLEDGGLIVGAFEKTASIEQQIENANTMNSLGGAVLLAIDFSFSDKKDVFVAITEAKKGQGDILSIDEIPAKHLTRSGELAEEIASAFSKDVKEFPLFPLLGVDMPGIFLKIECTREQSQEMFSKLQDSLQKFFKRGIKDETQRKTERQDQRYKDQ